MDRPELIKRYREGNTSLNAQIRRTYGDAQFVSSLESLVGSEEYRARKARAHAELMGDASGYNPIRRRRPHLFRVK
jgi:hypothetical protein